MPMDLPIEVKIGFQPKAWAWLYKVKRREWTLTLVETASLSLTGVLGALCCTQDATGDRFCAMLS